MIPMILSRRCGLDSRTQLLRVGAAIVLLTVVGCARTVTAEGTSGPRYATEIEAVRAELVEPLSAAGIAITGRAEAALNEIAAQAASELLKVESEAEREEASRNIHLFVDELKKGAVPGTGMHENSEVLFESAVLTARGICPLWPVCR